MSTDLEQRLRHHFTAVADELPLAAMTFDDVLAGQVRVSLATDDSTRYARRHPAQSLVLAAAAMLVVVVGLAAITGRWTDNGGPDAPVGPATEGRTLLSDITDLQPSDWVFATTLSDGVEWMYSTIGGTLEDRDRSTLYGTTNGGVAGEALRVSIGETSRPPGTGEAVDIAGTEWNLNTTNPAQWTAVRQLASTVVVVSGRGLYELADREVLAGLVVAPESALPSPALDSGRAVEVARYVLDGVDITFRVQETNGYWCTWVDGSGGCGGTIDPSALLTIESEYFNVAEGAATGRDVLAGTVTPDAVRVEVEYSDGTVVVVSPSDLSGRFDQMFWIAAADVPSTRRSVSVRAYGADDQLLATATAPPS